MASNANLYFGFFFLLVAGAIFGYEATTGRRIRMAGTEISLGWMALVFFFFNLARWWMWRSSQRRRRSDPERRYRPRSPGDEYLPEFDFSRGAEEPNKEPKPNTPEDKPNVPRAPPPATS